MRRRSIPEECREPHDGPRKVLQEKKSKLTLENPDRKRLDVVRVDDCAIREGERCDYLVRVPDGPELFIELKGSQIQKAADQLERSVRLLRTPERARECFIVSTRVPRLNPKIQGLKKKFKKELATTLTVKNSPCKVRV